MRTVAIFRTLYGSDFLGESMASVYPHVEKIVCFILGYLTIRLGHHLIASGVKGEFKFSTKLSGVSADLASVSPGLLFVLLGAMLIGLAMFKDKKAHYNKPAATDSSTEMSTPVSSTDQPPRDGLGRLPQRRLSSEG